MAECSPAVLTHVLKYSIDCRLGGASHSPELLTHAHLQQVGNQHLLIRDLLPVYFIS